jgi:hypothetical protein
MKAMWAVLAAVMVAITLLDTLVFNSGHHSHAVVSGGAGVLAMVALILLIRELVHERRDREKQ